MSELKALHLKKTYKKRTVVSDVSISVKSGSIVGLLGPNGAGKTTSFYMIVGIITSEDGQILLDDKDITAFPMHARARAGIGYLPQENSIFRKLTVYQNLMGVVELFRRFGDAFLTVDRRYYFILIHLSILLFLHCLVCPFFSIDVNLSEG